MGRCHEFGSQIREGCGHPMRAGEQSCACPECGVVCHGQFDGCPDVWARGPRPVSLTISPAIQAPRVRSLSAGPTAARPAPTTPPTANGSGNGYSAPAPPTPPPPRRAPADSVPPSGPGPRTEVLRWFEDAFDELRNELHAMAGAVTRQQAMLAELLDSRDAELRVVMVAESMPELVGEAAAKALNDQSDSLADIVAASLDDVRAAMQASELSGAAVMDGMRELLRRIEVTAEIDAQESHDDGMARLDALKASVGRQLRPVSAAIVEVAASIEGTDEREAARTKALKASVTRQLAPLVAAVERSDQQLAEIHARLDALGAPKVRAPRKAAAPTVEAVAAPARKVAPKRVATKKAAARKAAPAPTTTAARQAKPRSVKPKPDAGPETAIFYDYESPAPPPPPAIGLLARRRANRPPPLS